MGVTASAASLLVSPSSSSGIGSCASTCRTSREAEECEAGGPLELDVVPRGGTVPVEILIVSKGGNVVLCPRATAWAFSNDIVR